MQNSPSLMENTTKENTPICVLFFCTVKQRQTESNNKALYAETR